MVVIEKRLTWLRLIFRWRGAISTQIKGRVSAVVLVASILTIVDTQTPHLPHLTPLPFTLIGLALSIFLGFRNNTSYQRYWEGRILWGRLVNTSRTFARRVMTILDADTSTRQSLVRKQAAYVHALRLRLRSEPYAELDRLISDDTRRAIEARSNPPIALLEQLGDALNAEYKAGNIHAMHLPLFEEALTSMTDIQGGCERILTTPIPFSYTVLIHRIVAVYCFGLPFGIVESVGTFTPFVALLVSYAFLALDAIGDEIEEPFGSDAQDLPLAALSTMIERNVLEAAGATPLPELLTPQDDILR